MPYIRTCEIHLNLKFSFINNEKISELEVQLKSLERVYERKTQKVKETK